MRIFFLALWLSVALFARGAEEWQATLTPPQPGNAPPLRPLKAQYEFGWAALSAATADFEFSKVKGNQMRLAVKAKTTGAARALWRMDTDHTAYCDSTTLRPIRLEQKEVYKGKTETAKVTFTRDYLERWRETLPLPPGESPPKTRKVKLADVFDLQSALLFVRSQRLANGDKIRLIVYPGKSAYLAEVEVLGRENVKVAGKNYPAIKCQLRLQGITKELTLEPHTKFKQAFAWLSDDNDRLLLKAKADIFIGSVWAEMTSVKFPEK